MKIVTWNALRTNSNIIIGVQDLLKEGHDVICLQEAPSHHIKTLKALVPHSFVTKESTSPRHTLYNIVLSQWPIIQKKAIAHQRWVSLRSRFGKRADGLYFQQADIMKEGTPWRIINAHLILNAPPIVRIREWVRMVRCIKGKKHAIICGDFNTFASPLWALITGISMSYRLKDIPINERKMMQKFLQKKSLCNPFKGVRTQVHLPYQLDFVLFNNSLSFNHANRWPKRYGSDHWPLSITISPQQQQHKKEPLYKN